MGWEYYGAHEEIPKKPLGCYFCCGPRYQTVDIFIINHSFVNLTFIS